MYFWRSWWSDQVPSNEFTPIRQQAILTINDIQELRCDTLALARNELIRWLLFTPNAAVTPRRVALTYAWHGRCTILIRHDTFWHARPTKDFWTCTKLFQATSVWAACELTYCSQISQAFFTRCSHGRHADDIRTPANEITSITKC